MSDIYNTLTFDELVALAAQRGMTMIRFDAPPETVRAEVISWLISADEADREVQRQKMATVSTWKGMGPVAKRVFEGHKRAEETGEFAPETCPSCFGTGVKMVKATVPMPQTMGHKLPVIADVAARCECETERVREAMMAQRLSVVPARYKEAWLTALQPQPSRHRLQSTIVPFLKKHPDKSYFFCGNGDVGKSHFYWSLYMHAVRSERVVFASSLYDLIEAVKRSFDGVHLNPVEAMNQVLDATPNVAVFLDDVNKARPTEFVAETIFNFLDRIYRDKHQLVVTSQLSPEDLIQHFERVDQSYGLPIVRRMVNDDTVVWRMF